MMWLSKDDHVHLQKARLLVEKEGNNNYVFKAYNSKLMEQEIIKRDYVLYIPYRRKRGKEKKVEKMQCYKTHPAGRFIVERTNSCYNRFRKLFAIYEKQLENYLRLVYFSYCMIIYRRMILE